MSALDFKDITVKAYRVTYKYVGDIIYTEYDTVLLDEIPEPFVKKVTWDNVEECFSICRPIRWDTLLIVETTKKGKVLYDLNEMFNKYTTKYKEWKTPLNAYFVISYEECDISMDELLNYKDSNMVIKYISERI